MSKVHVVGKTEKVLLSLSPKKSNEIGRQIEDLLKGDMAYIVNKYCRNYRMAVFDTFGWTKEDLMQQVRIMMWRGLATFDPSKKFKITTYLSVILYHYFLSLSKRCRSKKNSQTKLMCVEEVFDPDQDENFELPDDWIHYTRALNLLVANLSKGERIILHWYFTKGKSPQKLARRLRLSKKEFMILSENLAQKLRIYIKTEFNKDGGYDP